MARYNNKNNGATGTIPVPGALTPKSKEGIAVFSGDVYDEYFGKNQSELNKQFAQGGTSGGTSGGDTVISNCECNDLTKQTYVASKTIYTGTGTTTNDVLSLTSPQLKKGKVYGIFTTKIGKFLDVLTLTKSLGSVTEYIIKDESIGTELFYVTDDTATYNITSTIANIEESGKIVYEVYELNTAYIAKYLFDSLYNFDGLWTKSNGWTHNTYISNKVSTTVDVIIPRYLTSTDLIEIEVYGPSTDRTFNYSFYANKTSQSGSTQITTDKYTGTKKGIHYLAGNKIPGVTFKLNISTTDGNTYNGQVNYIVRIVPIAEVVKRLVNGVYSSNSSTGESHSHSNLTVLDSITQELITAWNNASTNSHTHTNQNVLNGITQDKVNAWDSKSDFDGSYNSLTDKPTIPSTTGLLSKSEADETYQEKGTYLTEHQSLTEYAKKTDIPSLQEYAKKSEIPSLEDYAKKTDIPDITNKADKSEIPDISGLAAKNEIPSLEGYSTTAEMNAAITSAIANAQLGGGEGSDVDLSIYLTSEVASQTYAKKSDIPDTSNLALKSEIPSLSGYAKTSDLTSYAKKSEIPSVTGLLSKTEADESYQPKGTYLTEHQSLSEYAKKSEIPSTEGLLTESAANEAYQPKGNYLTEHQSLSAYAKKTEIPSVDGLLSKSEADSTYQEKGDYLTEHQSLIEYAKKTDIPSLTGYAKTTDLSSYAKKTEVPSIEGLARVEDIPSLEGYAKSSEIPDVSGFATKSEIPSLTGYAKLTDIPDTSNFITEHQSLAEYAKKSEIPSLEGYAKSTDIPSLTEYAKKSEIPSVSGLITETSADSKYQPKGTYLTEHQSLTDYAKKTDIPDVSGLALRSEIPSIEGLAKTSDIPDVTGFAKTEDIPSVDGLLSEETAAETYEILGNNVIVVNTEFPETLQANKTYEIKGDVVLTEQLNVPENVTFNFNGGTITGAGISCIDSETETYYKDRRKRLLLLGNVDINVTSWTGGFANDEIDLEWFNPSMSFDETENVNHTLVSSLVAQLHDQVLNIGQMYPICNSITITSGSATISAKTQFQGGYGNFLSSCNAGFYIVNKCFGAIVLNGGRLNLKGITCLGATTAFIGRNPRFNGSYSDTITDKYGRQYTISTEEEGSLFVNHKDFCGFDLQKGACELIEDCCFNGFARGISLDGSKRWSTCTPGFVNRCFISSCKWGVVAIYASDVFFTNCKFNSCLSDTAFTKNSTDVSRNLKIQANIDDSGNHDDFGGAVMISSSNMIQFDACRWEFNYMGIFIDNNCHNVNITGSIFDRHTHSILTVYNRADHYITSNNYPDRHNPAIGGINFTDNNILRGTGIRNDWDSADASFSPGVAYFCIKSVPEDSTDENVIDGTGLRHCYLNISDNIFTDNIELLSAEYYDKTKFEYQHAIFMFDCSDKGGVELTMNGNNFKASKATHFCEFYNAYSGVKDSYVNIEGSGNTYTDDINMTTPYYHSTSAATNDTIARFKSSGSATEYEFEEFTDEELNAPWE